MNLLQLGKQIKKHREAKRLTQESLAALIDKSPNFVSELERGMKAPSLETLIHIVNALEISTDTLLKEDLIVKDKIMNQELSEKLAQVNPKYYDVVLDLVQSLLAIEE